MERSKSAREVPELEGDALLEEAEERYENPGAWAALFVVPRPFQTTGQELASRFAGILSHKRRSGPRTAKPGTEAFPREIMELRKLTALALILKA